MVDEKGVFRQDNFQKALASLGEPNLDTSKKSKKKPTEGSDLFKILKLIMDRKFDPVIIFSFSKRDVEGYGMAMTKFDLTTEQEKEKIEVIFKSAIDCLSE